MAISLAVAASVGLSACNQYGHPRPGHHRPHDRYEKRHDRGHHGKRLHDRRHDRRHDDRRGPW
ncbi:hypothetical protein [Novosphingobium sp. BW1]|uniref:hypothetical protein n=1 Tax=Novosphingobium sp. BW1 TaxID=2592621 RepID=UPI0011DF6391|nr:hypothetical protein [Novosphingobium sp. BW1]